LSRAGSGVFFLPNWVRHASLGALCSLHQTPIDAPDTHSH
jgi:hypothetical protein